MIDSIIDGVKSALMWIFDATIGFALYYILWALMWVLGILGQLFDRLSGVEPVTQIENGQK